jgi:hypothetical protein
VNATGDELAGVVDLFGALTPAELGQAIEEVAFKRGENDPEIRIEAAIDDYRLVAIERDEPTEDGDRKDDQGASGADGWVSDNTLLVAGPTAFPTLPAGAEDLPHILSIESRTVAPERMAAAVERRYRTEAARAVAEGDRETITDLLDVSYALESWGPSLDLATARTRLDEASE